MKRVIIALVLIVLIILPICITANAVDQPNDELILFPEKREVFVNSSITSKYKYLTGLVYAESTKDVYFRMKYKIGSANYTTDTSLLIARQSTNNWFYDRKSANNLSTKAYWRFELDNYGVLTKGGFAQGWMWGQ